MGRGQAFLEQQAHRVAFIAKRGLYAHQHIPPLLAQHKNGLAVAQLAPRCRAPLGFDLLEPGFALHMVFGRDQVVHIGVGAVLRGVAVQQAFAQGVHAVGHVHGVALGLHGSQGVEDGLEHAQVSGAADVAGVGREVEHHQGELALGALAAAQGHHFAHARGQHVGALGA